MSNLLLPKETTDAIANAARNVRDLAKSIEYAMPGHGSGRTTPSVTYLVALHALIRSGKTVAEAIAEAKAAGL